MRYTVRYVLEGFVEKEQFKTLREAKKYYNEIMKSLGNYILEIQLYENE